MIDIVQFKIYAGNGGNGLVSFHREKFVHHGGPDGGDGGRGGNVYVRGNNKLSSLREYRDQQLRRSANGFPGGPNQRHGAAGEGAEGDEGGGGAAARRDQGAAGARHDRLGRGE